MTRKKLERLKQDIARLRSRKRVSSKEVERLAKMVRRQREAGNQWSHRVLSSRPPLIIPKAEVLTKGTLNAALDTLDGDINDYEETFDQPIEPKNGYHH